MARRRGRRWGASADVSCDARGPLADGHAPDGGARLCARRPGRPAAAAGPLPAAQFPGRSLLSASAAGPPPPSTSWAASPTADFGGTRVDVLDSARAIGTQNAAYTKGFLPFDQVAHDAQQLRMDYERLRITWEVTREIGLERDIDKLLEKSSSRSSSS